MSPIPDDHYDAASPLDGGSSPSGLGGNPAKYSPTGLEIGLIVGVVSLVLVSILWLFVWRSRRNRATKNADAGSATTAAAETAGADNDHSRHGQNTDSGDVDGTSIPAPLPKDERSSSGDNDRDHEERASSIIERPPRSRARPAMAWNHWGQPSQRTQVEEHEMKSRV